MAEDGRPSKRGHCLALLPYALWLFVTSVVFRPSRWRDFWSAEVYPPEAAEVPEALDCGCELGAAIYTCLECSAKRCATHHWAHPCVDVVPDQAEQTAKALLTPDCPSIVAGSAIDASQWAGIVQRLPELAAIDAKALEAFYLVTNPAWEQAQREEA